MLETRGKTHKDTQSKQTAAGALFGPERSRREEDNICPRGTRDDSGGAGELNRVIRGKHHPVAWCGCSASRLECGKSQLRDTAFIMIRGVYRNFVLTI